MIYFKLPFMKALGKKLQFGNTEQISAVNYLNSLVKIEVLIHGAYTEMVDGETKRYAASVISGNSEFNDIPLPKDLKAGDMVEAWVDPKELGDDLEGLMIV